LAVSMSIIVPESRADMLIALAPACSTCLAKASGSLVWGVILTLKGFLMTSLQALTN